MGRAGLGANEHDGPFGFFQQGNCGIHGGVQACGVGGQFCQQGRNRAGACAFCGGDVAGDLQIRRFARTQGRADDMVDLGRGGGGVCNAFGRAGYVAHHFKLVAVIRVAQRVVQHVAAAVVIAVGGAGDQDNGQVFRIGTANGVHGGNGTNAKGYHAAAAPCARA